MNVLLLVAPPRRRSRCRVFHRPGAHSSLTEASDFLQSHAMPFLMPIASNGDRTRQHANALTPVARNPPRWHRKELRSCIVSTLEQKGIPRANSVRRPDWQVAFQSKFVQPTSLKAITGRLSGQRAFSNQGQGYVSSTIASTEPPGGRTRCDSSAERSPTSPLPTHNHPQPLPAAGTCPFAIISSYTANAPHRHCVVPATVGVAAYHTYQQQS